MLLRRHGAVYAAAAALLITAVLSALGVVSVMWNLPPLMFCGLSIYDLLQKRHSVLRNYPILGHFRFLFESIRPEIRQYLVEGDAEELPFSRSQRSVVYQRAKNTLDSLAFGTKVDVRADGHEWLSHSLVPSQIDGQDFRVIVGADRGQPYSMSVFNISAMSFGALSANAIRALNLGAKMGGFAHDTGEGSLSPYHRENQGDLVWQIGSGYFGCRHKDGSFDPEAFAKRARDPQVKMIEVKLSQGAKPGHGGVLPAKKITAEIAETRGVPMGQDCVSPAAHSEFSTPKGLLEFIERLRTLSGGKPTGVKLCLGAPWEFFSIAKAMLETGIRPDFIVVDGAEGGTGASPLEFADHVGTPLQEGLLLVHNTLLGIGLRDQIRIGASGKLITAFDIARTLAVGADWVNSARGFMFAVGCIQAQKCNSGECPTGVATQDPSRQRAIVVPNKAQRVFHYHHNTLHALKELLQAAGLQHPSELRPHHILRRVSSFNVQPLSDLLEYLEPGDLLTNTFRHRIYAQWWPASSSESFALPKNGLMKQDASKPEKQNHQVIWCKVSQEQQGEEKAT